jgi:DNA-binding transcriptional LysR family regulator
MMLVTGRAELAATCRRLRDLARVPFVASKQGTRLAEIASRYFLRHKHQPETAMRLDNADAVRAVVRTRFGYALLPEWTLGDDLAEGRLFALETVERPPATAMELLRPSATPLTPAVQEFIRIAQGRALGTTKAVVSPR